MTTSEQIIEGFAGLVQRFIHQRPRLIQPEHAVHIQQQMESLRGNNAGGIEDYDFLIRVFVTLAHSETTPTMGELSAGLGMSLSSATRIVDWLVRADCVERIADPHDRRVVRVRIAEKGQRLYQAANAHNSQRIAALLSHFTVEEQQELLRLLTKLFDALLIEEQERGSDCLASPLSEQA